MQRGLREGNRGESAQHEEDQEEDQDQEEEEEEEEEQSLLVKIEEKGEKHLDKEEDNEIDEVSRDTVSFKVEPIFDVSEALRQRRRRRWTHVCC